jgi:crossover junction endodeoxyribonuclease RuvC
LSIVLGLDPGSRVTGFGVLKVSSSSSRHPIQLVSFGVIQLDVKRDFSLRMMELSQGIEQILKKYKPEAVAIEKIFLGKNADSAFKLGHARGVLMSESAKAGAEVFQYATRIVKKSLTGKGSGGKDEVQMMVQKLLGIREIKQADASDALALAIHHAYQSLSGTSAMNRMLEVEL